MPRVSASGSANIMLWPAYSDFRTLTASVSMVYGLMIVDALVAVGAAVWCFYLLKVRGPSLDL